MEPPPLPSRRHRSSTAASNPSGDNAKTVEMIRALLSVLTHNTVSGLQENGYPDPSRLVKDLRKISEYMVGPTAMVYQDAFRHAGGFESIFHVLRRFSGFYNPDKRTDKEMASLFKLLAASLDAFAAAMSDHAGNRRFFKFRVEGGGWEALEQSIASIGLGGAEPNPWVSCHVFGKLFAFALGDESTDLLFQTIAETLRQDNERTNDNESQSEPDEQWDLVLARSVESIEPKVRELVDSNTMIQHPEILRAIVSFWMSIPREKGKPASPTSLLVLETILRAADVLMYNRSVIHTNGVMSQFLRAAFTPSLLLTDVEKGKALEICRLLMPLGVNRPADTQFLLSNPSPEASEFCLTTMAKYTGPSYFQFDLSLLGYTSLELPSLPRPFPPQTSPGYTFTAWIWIDKFDSKAHTTLFGAFDTSQTCFVLMYLERDTKNFILQTSVYSNKPSVRFKSAVFREQQWYHVAVVHRRPKALTASKASLYVNGEFTEQAKCNYPQIPPVSANNSEGFASFGASQSRPNPVQTFFGTPKELAGQATKGVISSRWSLASAHLFEDVLSDDYIAVHYCLGPQYQGNYQDTLGGFQTYEASAKLGLRNEIVHPGKDEPSEILKAIREKASSIVPESRLLLSILPSATFPENVQYLDNGLLRSLPRASARSLFAISSREGAPLAMNCAVPNLTDSLFRSQGIVSFRGKPIVVMPSFLDENLWRLAGFTPLALKLLERATTADETVRAMEIMFHSIQVSWRNSEAMERDGGYGILSMLLRFKIGAGGVFVGEGMVPRLILSPEERDSLSFRILSLILGFVGYNHKTPIDSLIVNPLAYRILLIDLDIWRRSAPRIQELYYKQFLTFAVNSKHHDFNSRRLVRMRIVKRLLDAMKGEAVPETIAEHFMTAFEVLVKANLSPEVMRLLSLFITYAFHKPSISRTPRPVSAISRPSTPSLIRRPMVDGSGASTPAGVKFLTRKQLGTRVLSLYTTILCDRDNTNHIKKFAKTVTNKWLLYLLNEDDPEVVVQGCKILARLLVSHGSGYTSKFAGKSGGFTIMANRTKKFWYLPRVWAAALCLFFGVDVATIDMHANFGFSDMTDVFVKRRIVYPDAVVIIASLLQAGLNDVIRHDSSVAVSRRESAVNHEAVLNPENLVESINSKLTIGDGTSMEHRENMLQEASQLLLSLQEKSLEFKEFAANSDWIRLLLLMLYPVMVSTDPLTADVELNSRDSALNFEGNDVIIRPIGSSSAATPIIRTSSVNLHNSPQNTPPKGTPLRRASSFVLLTSHSASEDDNKEVDEKGAMGSEDHGPVVQNILNIALRVFMEQIFSRKEFSGFGLFTKVPPGFQEHQAYFVSYLLKEVMKQSTKRIQDDQKMLCEPRTITNLSRLSMHLTEAIFEGWFIDGAEMLIDFSGMLLEYLQRPDIAALKSVRLCHQAVLSIRSCLLRVILLKLSDLDTPKTSDDTAKQFMNKLAYWQMSILSCFTSEDDYLKLFWYQMYTKLVDRKQDIRLAAANFLRILLVQCPEESMTLIRSFITPDQRRLTTEFMKLTEIDDETFVQWVDKNRPSLDLLFFGGMAKTWESFVSIENTRTTETAKGRLLKRKERLRYWYAEDVAKDKILGNHEAGNSAWMKSIYSSEYFKHQRLLQDQQDDLTFSTSAYKKMERDLRRPGAVFAQPGPLKWKLDRTEGRNRMRLRLLPDYSAQEQKYQPRAKGSGTSTPTLKVNAAGTPPVVGDGAATLNTAHGDDKLTVEDDFELIEDPNDAQDMDENFEDKNRKVMRRLNSGDQVQAAYNISRVTGLEACEGILIIGKDSLYMMDNVFQCVSGDIVNVWEAPVEERDPFTRVVTGAKTLEKRQNAGNREQESRSWKWQDLISISKRRFLFRDVAIEIFFTDGRSYLMTAINPSVRDEMFAKMMSKAPHTNSANSLPNPEDAWRLEALKAIEESPQGLGSKLGTLFNSSPWNPTLKKWQKGEMSNFHYLMMVNTMAGRTFNDLTQYPVFPWILADYTSDDLDLEDPATFRDLSKPMGAQTQDRIQGFLETHSALKEIGQEPFHYGTHYSSAMIVSSYLIRLPPFVQSYLLLQGDSFDHADRLFQSIPDAWKSASSRNKTDVRELIPEFFCVPEFLTNMNGYDFGRRQSNGVKVDNVLLPPWAKGDPKIFIAKHREALESPYVSENLHHWIDLVFGHKQRGEAAEQNLNVFHHLSYAGASNLDSITDVNERAITAGVIHNFGQTPHQVFTKPHPARETVTSLTRRLDTAVFSLACLPNPLIECHERVASLVHAPKLDRLLCASAFRLHVAPFDKYLEWGFADNSVRFYFSDNRRPAGLFENLHIGQISFACFADSKTLITAGEDCVVSVYMVKTSPGKPVELMPKSSLFGHKTPITAMAVSKSFSTFVSVSADGQALLWDLNQLAFIRKLPLVRQVECAKINDVTGEILLCSGPNVVLYTLNGALLVEQNVCQDRDDYVHSCAFYEGAGSEWLENNLIFTGHRKGVVNVWRRSMSAGKWTLELLRRLDHVDYKAGMGENVRAGITCISPRPQSLYTGDEEGRVFEWNFASRER